MLVCYTLLLVQLCFRSHLGFGDVKVQGTRLVAGRSEVKFCDFKCLPDSHALKEAAGNYWSYSKTANLQTTHLRSHDSFLASCIAALLTLLRMGQVEVHEMSRCRLDPCGIFRDRTSRHCDSTVDEPALSTTFLAALAHS